MGQHYASVERVRFELVTGFAQNLYDALLEGHFDVVLADLDSFRRLPTLTYDKLINVNFSVFAHAAHPLFHRGEEPDERALRAYDFAIYKHSVEELDTIVSDTRRYNPSEESRIGLVTTSLENLVSTLSRTSLVVSLPQQLSNYLARHDVFELSSRLRCSPFASGAVYRINSSRYEVIKTFIEYLREETRSTEA